MQYDPDLYFLFDYLRIISVVLIPVGILLLLYGYKLFKLFIGLIGFLGGSVLGFSLSFIAGDPLFTSLLCGVIGAFLFYILYRIGLFLTGFVFGAFLSLIFASALSGDVAIASFILGGFLGGILALQLEKLIVIILSSYKGSIMLLGGTALVVFPEQQARLFETVSSNPESIISLLLNYSLLLLIVTLVGILYQYEVIPNRIDIYLPDFLKSTVSKKEKKNQSVSGEQIDGCNRKTEILSKTQEDRMMANGDDWKRSLFPKEKPTSTYVASSEYDNLNISWESISPAHSQVKSAKITPEASKDKITNSSISKTLRQQISTTVFQEKKPNEGILELAVRPYVQFYEHLTGSIFKSKKQETKLFPLIGLICSGPQAGQQFKIQGVFNGKYYSATLGRGDYTSPNHVKLNDPSAHISRRHAELAMIGQDFFIRNISVANPIYLNNIKIEHDAFTRIMGGDKIHMGNIKIEIMLAK